MANEFSSFRWLFLPYCLIQQEDGSYVVANRRYKPVGLTRKDWVDYEEYPVKVRFKRKLSAAQARNLDCLGREETDRIYFYNDGCIPTDSQLHWDAYSKRLQKLAAYQVTEVAPA
ncbi:MAG: hypothetical protein Q7K57_51785 [Burkholderiaceae bacterium]|nr:hypothetical protein [Burkholderiaceae bacterium]